MSASLVAVRFSLSQQVVRGDRSSYHAGEGGKYSVERTRAGSKQHEIADLGCEKGDADPIPALR